MEIIEPLLMEEDKEQAKQVDVIIVDKEEFIKVEEENHMEVETISNLEEKDNRNYNSFNS